MIKKKLLIVIQLVRSGGVELVAINFARHLDRKKYDISFLLINPYENQDEEFVRELKQEGFSIYSMPENIGGTINKYKYIYSFIKQGRYDIVHSHVILFSAVVLLAAKRAGVKVRASHSHIIKWNRKENIAYKLYKFVMSKLLNYAATLKFACSKQAGEFLYGKRGYKNGGIFIPNGIDTSKYILDTDIRNRKRDELGISGNTILVGHIGTVYSIKNQTFLVKIFAEMLKENSNMKLLLVGEKVDIQPVLDIAEELGITDRVELLGQRKDVNELLQAFDIMIFPSLHEALPVSLIEAQAAKLPCLISDAVTTEVKFNSNAEFLSLSDSTQKWSKSAFNLLSIERGSISTDALKSSYDIKAVVKQLDILYSE